MFTQSIAINEDLTNRRWLFLLILTLMSTAGLVGSDIYLPMLPNIGLALNRNIEAIQFTLAIYLFGLAVGQLLLGALTDSFGRKKIVLIGMLLYLVSSIACAYSHTYLQMIIARFMQAIGACSGLVIGRAIVGDLFDKREAGKIFASIFPFVGMSPAISPVLGGFIGYYFGWQATFLFIGLFALSIVLLSFIYLPETLPHRNRQPFRLPTIIGIYAKLLINKKFIFYTAAPCIAYIAYFAYIAQSPFIFQSYGYGERTIGTFYITLSFTYIIGNLTGKKLLNSLGLNQVLARGYYLFVLGGMFFLITSFTPIPLLLMTVSASLLTFGNGFLIPVGVAGVISASSKSTGYASGLLGFLQLGCAALSSSFVGVLSQNTIFGLGLYIFIITVIGFILYLLGRNLCS